MCAPADVQSGLACGCTCIGCGAILIAKKGAKKRWHFAHHNVEIGESCAESAIHAAAKQVLLEQNWLRLPGMCVVVHGQAMSGQVLEESSVLSEGRVVRFERSCAEVWETGSAWHLAFPGCHLAQCFLALSGNIRTAERAASPRFGQSESRYFLDKVSAHRCHGQILTEGSGSDLSNR